ncbi:hypothetical protein NIIDMKKI_56760 [Mycobacterium kansasii]|uniref:Linear gramicidin synthetase subunit D domain protein n=1 Tax=Mycobacterium kansasii TaxID=1768 RepID=A0A7G1II38_MYCKA|nr:hypothetical protein NIIDMKKI_56760 [Mycobacterium kansasii]
MGEVAWARVVAGDTALGAVVKDVKEQLRALPDGLTYGMLRYLNADVALPEPEPRSASTTWDAWALPRRLMTAGGSAPDPPATAARDCRCR